MSQESRPNLSLTIFDDRKPSLDIYREELDPDRRAAILNEIVVQKEEGVATQDTIRDLVTMSAESAEIQTYRPDHIAALSPENLVAVARGFVTERLEGEDQMFEAIKQIQKAAGLEETDMITIEKSEKILREDVLSEMAERLHEDLDITERKRLMQSLADLPPTELQELLNSHQDLKAAILTHFQELPNGALRDAIILSQHRAERNIITEEQRESYTDWPGDEEVDDDEGEYSGFTIVGPDDEEYDQ